jgi:hypothetical protein
LATCCSAVAVGGGRRLTRTPGRVRMDAASGFAGGRPGWTVVGASRCRDGGSLWAMGATLSRGCWSPGLGGVVDVPADQSTVHASWLNQIEIHFSILQRKVLTPTTHRPWRGGPAAAGLPAPLRADRGAVRLALHQSRPGRPAPAPRRKGAARQGGMTFTQDLPRAARGLLRVGSLRPGGPPTWWRQPLAGEQEEQRCSSTGSRSLC